MSKNQNKTQVTDDDIHLLLNSLEDEQQRADCSELVALMQRISGYPPKMWGTAIIGFGQYHYKYASGREGDFFITGFSPRKANLSLYIMAGFSQYQDLLATLGKHKTGKSCLYIKRLADVDTEVLARMIQLSVDYMHASYPTST